jgi:uncharacterized protein YggU (UPF0235/DUF167 family)
MFFEKDLFSISVFVKAFPRSKKLGFGEILDCGRVKIYLTKPAENDLANRQIVDFLAVFLNVSKSKISIQSGHRSQLKTVLISQITPEIVQKLEQLL